MAFEALAQEHPSASYVQLLHAVVEDVVVLHWSRQMRKALPVIIVIIIVIIAGSFWLVGYRKKKAAGQEVVYREVSPTRGPIAQTVAASGSVTSNLDVEIKCKASGTIITLPYDVSDNVSAGALLLELDPRDEKRNVDLAGVNLNESQARLSRANENLGISQQELATSLERARVELEVAQAQAEDTKAKAARTQELFDQGYISQQDYDQAMTDVVSAEANVDSANIKFEELKTQEAGLALLRHDVAVASGDVQSSQINLEIANQRFDDTKVYSPMDGIVTQRLVQAGQIISSGISSTSGGTSIMTVSDLSRLFVLANVDESDIGRVSMGQKVDISVDAYPNEKFKGEVVRISPVGVNVQSVVTFEVRIEVTSENKSRLMPQMTADAEIVISQVEDAWMVPSNAVQTLDGKTVVLVKGENGSPTPREVVTGVDNGESIQIVSGLTGNETVLVSDTSQSSMFSQQGRRGGPPPGMMMMGRPR
jgi:HlyD family secretion protein